LPQATLSSPPSSVTRDPRQFDTKTGEKSRATIPHWWTDGFPISCPVEVLRLSQWSNLRASTFPATENIHFVLDTFEGIMSQKRGIFERWS
jgi:hypothetical protein